MRADESFLWMHEVKLMRSLGLTPPTCTFKAGEYNCGTYVHAPDGMEQWRCTVELHVTPAHFWLFVIDYPDGTTKRWGSGTGQFNTFWPAVSLLADHMLVEE